MKGFTTALIALLFMTFMVSCEEETIEPDGLELPGTFTLKIAEPLVSNDDDFNLSITKIEDSRCPANVECVWEGVGVIAISFTHDGATQTFDLHTDSSQRGTLLVSSIVSGYYFEIVSLTPYPDGNFIEQDDYEVEILIEER